MSTRTTMTTGKIAKINEMREQGMTFQQIGDAMGFSRQYACNLVQAGRSNICKPLTPEQCVYPGLRKWMNDHEMNQSGLLRKMGHDSVPNSVYRLSRYLRGETYPSKPMIDDILRVTGLTYEQCFGGRDDG